MDKGNRIAIKQISTHWRIKDTGNFQFYYGKIALVLKGLNEETLKKYKLII